MAQGVWIKWWYSSTTTISPAAETTTGIGELVVLGPDGGTPISGQIASYTSAAEIAAALSAGNIDAQTAEDLTASIAQDLRLSRVWVATYAGGETVDDAMDRVIALGTIDVGMWSVVERTDAVIHAVGVWLAANSPGFYASAAQTDDTSVLGGSKPVGLDAYETAYSGLFYSVDGEPTCAAWAGRIAAFPQVNGPALTMVRLTGVATAAVDQPQIGTITDADAMVLTPRDIGAGASERVVAGPNSYAGTDMSLALTIVYLNRRLKAAVTAGVAYYQITGKALRTDPAGQMAVSSWLTPVFEELSEAGHFTPGTITEAGEDVALPGGYRLTISVSGSSLLATGVVLIAQQAYPLAITIDAREV